MFEIISITGPIYILMALGYPAVRFRLIQPEAAPVLSRFVLYFALPALLFSVVYSRKFDEIFNLSCMVIYAFGSLSMLAFGYIALRRIAGLDHQKAGHGYDGNGLPQQRTCWLSGDCRAGPGT